MDRRLKLLFFALVIVALWVTAAADWPLDSLPELPGGIKYPWSV